MQEKARDQEKVREFGDVCEIVNWNFAKNVVNL